MSSARRRYETPSVAIGRFRGGFTFGAADVMPFRFRAPGARAMLTIVFIVRQIVDSDSTHVPGPASQPPNANGIFDWTSGAGCRWLLWLARTKIDGKGAGVRVPTGNILGTRTAPAVMSNQAVAQDGLSFDVTGGADGIDGELTLDATIGGFEPDPTWQVAAQGRYNAIQQVCDAEWAAMTAAWGSSPEAKESVFTF